MKKRVFSGLLALVFCLSLIPATAFAAGEPDISATGVTIGADALAGVTYKAGDGTVTVSRSDHVLTVALNNAVIGSAASPADQGIYVDNLYSQGIYQIAVTLSGESSIATMKDGFNFTRTPVTFSGSGSLTIDGVNSAISRGIIAQNADLEFFDGSVNIINCGISGIYTDDCGVTIGGTASLTAKNNINAGVFVTTTAKDRYVIVTDNAKLTVSGSEDGVYAVLSSEMNNYGYINISGNAQVSVTKTTDYGLAADSVSISGNANVFIQVDGTAESGGDVGIWASGASDKSALTISGGTVHVNAATYGASVGDKNNFAVGSNMIISGTAKVDINEMKIAGYLVLDNASVSGRLRSAAGEALVVELVGHSTFTAQEYEDAFRATGDIFFFGSGSLDIKGGDFGVWVEAVPYLQNDGTIVYKGGIVYISGVTVNISGTKRGLYAEGGVYVESDGVLSSHGSQRDLWTDPGIIVDKSSTLDVDYLTLFEGGIIEGYDGPAVWMSYDYDAAAKKETYLYSISGKGTVDASVIDSGMDGLTVGEDITLTVDRELTLDDKLEIKGDLENNGTIINDSVLAVKGSLKNSGTITNNSIIVIYGDSITSRTVKALGLKGDGTVVAIPSSGSKGTVYTNSGEKIGDMTVVSGDLNLTTAAGIASAPSGLWNASTSTLKLKNTYIDGYVRLPKNSTISVKGLSGINGAVKTAATLKLSGGAELILSGDMTVLNSDDVTEWLPEGASISSSGKVDGPVILQREKTDDDDDEEDEDASSGGATSGGSSSGGSSFGGGSGSGGSSGGSGGSADSSFGGMDVDPGPEGLESDDGTMPLDGDDRITEKFLDVDENDWYWAAVNYVMEEGLMTGYDGKFDPDDDLTRAQLAQILYNSADKPDVNSPSPFADVGQGKWYTDAIIWAQSEGYVTGYGDGDFGPNDDVTREEMAVILWRMAGSPASSYSLTSFPDSASVSSWATNAMAWAVEKGIINGLDGNLAPNSHATRAQTAKMLMNYFG